MYQFRVMYQPVFWELCSCDHAYFYISYIPFCIAETKPVEKAVVRYSYVAENEDELTLNEGEIVTVVDKDIEDSGWWKGELNGRVGVFPDNFVEIIKEDVSFMEWLASQRLCPVSQSTSVSLTSQ